MSRLPERVPGKQEIEYGTEQHERVFEPVEVKDDHWLQLDAAAWLLNCAVVNDHGTVEMSDVLRRNLATLLKVVAREKLAEFGRGFKLGYRIGLRDAVRKVNEQASRLATAEVLPNYSGHAPM